MSRYQKVILLIGGCSALVWVGAHAIGLFLLLDNGLATLLGITAPFSKAGHWVAGFIAIAAAFGLAWSTLQIPKAEFKLVVGIVGLLEILTLTAVMALYKVYLSPFAALLAGISSMALALAYSETEAGSRLRRFRQAFGRRISDATYRKVLNARQGPALGGELRDLTIMVCEWSREETEDLRADDWITSQNRLTALISEVVLAEGGFLDQSNGTHIRAVFGAPLQSDTHGATACAAALELHERLVLLNNEFRILSKPTVECRIGINTGVAIAGALGFPTGEYTVSGQAVDRAYALSRENLTYGSHILLGGRTVQSAEGKIESRPLELLSGDSEEELDEVHELLGKKDALSPEEIARRDAFWHGVIYFRSQRWDEALHEFLNARPNHGTVDTPVEIYLSRLDHVRSPMRRARVETVRRLYKL